jgi:hypothetical protein
MPADFDCLYFLDNSTLCILEIKRIDVADHAPAEEKYQWLLLYKEHLDIKPLLFKSQDNSGEVEERFFDLGYLKFDLHEGVFIEKFNSAQHRLQNKDCKQFPEKYQNAVTRFLEG